MSDAVLQPVPATPSRRRPKLPWLFLAYGVALLVGLPLARLRGERDAWSGLLIFLPITVWLLPLLAGWLFKNWRRSWPVRLGTVLGLAAIFFHADLHFNGDAGDTEDSIRIVSNNIGQRKFSSLIGFLRQEKPDLIALQEGWRQEKTIRAEWPELYVAKCGQFLLASRGEVKSTLLLSDLKGVSGPAAARFELDWKGQAIIVYSVHLPTPRRELTSMRGRALLSPSAWGEVAEAMTERVQLAEELRRRINAETAPCLIMGDFNSPSIGYIHQQMTETWLDAFAERGFGPGWTLPGATMNPLSFFGPWLRIDYIFTDRKHWEVLSAKVEGRKAAQHLAVSAQVRLRKE